MLTPAKRFLVRTLLITGCTLSTLIGVQTLASMDAAKSTVSSDAEITLDEPARTETLVPMFDLPTSSVVTGQATVPQIQIVTNASQIQRVDPSQVQARAQESR